MIVDGRGRAIAFQIVPAQAHEPLHVPSLLDRLPGVTEWLAGDRGNSSHRFREAIRTAGAWQAISPKSNEAPIACPDRIYHNRNIAERLWARLQERRAIAARYDKTFASFVGVLRPAATLDWIK